MHGAQRRRIARYSKELQRRHVPPQARHSRCSVIHPTGDHNHQAIFFKIRNLLLEWSGQLIFRLRADRLTHDETTASPKKQLKSLLMRGTNCIAIAVLRKAFRATFACCSLSQEILSDQDSAPSYSSYATNPSLLLSQTSIFSVKARKPLRDTPCLSLKLTICTYMMQWFHYSIFI
ncbi:MAG: hypothetical protein P8179_09025 [Candidatus Thiodiazotropha sp.]